MGWKATCDVLIGFQKILFMLINPEMHSVRLISQNVCSIAHRKESFVLRDKRHLLKKRGRKTKQETNKQYAIRTVADTSSLDLILYIGKDTFKLNHLLVTFGITMDSRYEKTSP